MDCNITEKICTTCNLKRPISDFYPGKGKYNTHSHCKYCVRERTANWRKSVGVDKTREYNKRYREENPDKIKKKRKEYEKNNRQKITANMKEYRKSYNIKNKDVIIKNRKEVYQKNKDIIRNKAFFKLYGITLEDKNIMLKEQDYKCLGCNVNIGNGNKACTDHCHSTGKVRGLLCTTCNFAIGSANDNPTILRNLANYLEKYI